MQVGAGNPWRLWLFNLGVPELNLSVSSYRTNFGATPSLTNATARCELQGSATHWQSTH